MQSRFEDTSWAQAFEDAVREIDNLGEDGAKASTPLPAP